MNYTDGDKVKVLVMEVVEGDPSRYRVRLRHRDYSADRDWSYCDVWVLVPAAVGTAEAGDERAIVLTSTARSVNEAFAGGYSCKVREAFEPPPFPVERADEERRYAGFVQREEPPAAGAVIFHMGSGLTCYPDLSCAEGATESELMDGEWWEMVLPELHALCFEPIA